MMQLTVDITLALLVLFLTALLVHQGGKRPPQEGSPAKAPLDVAWDDSCAKLARRIFDPSDYLWLRNELNFPEGARLLARHRKQLALEWLRALRRSFNELVRTPESTGAPGEAEEALSSWQLLWLTLRFHFLSSYALFVVRFFGPYHRLIPSFGWTDVLAAFGHRRGRYRLAGRNTLP